MVKLLILADDFTGALDTGVQFAVHGIATLVEMERSIDYDTVEEDIEVLVLDTETRHLEAKEAYEIAANAVADAKHAGVSYIYKKTDSALRGNIGAELAAMYDGSGEKQIHFIPAFPKMNRITRNGVHYIDGIPVGESVFGQDPFEPVRVSSLDQIIGEQSAIPVRLIRIGEERTKAGDGILVYDAETDEQIAGIAKDLQLHGGLNFCAGCAGFASALSEILWKEGESRETPRLPSRLFVACGSVNPITVSQLDYAEKKGADRIRMSERQKFSADWLNEDGAENWIRKMKSLCEKQGICILDSNDRPGEDKTGEYRKKHGIDLDQARQSIASNIGSIVKKLLDEGLQATLMITGGDTLKGFLEKVGISRLRPVCEVMPGTVISDFVYRNQIYYVVSKSGGFGEEKLIEELRNLL